MNTENRFPSKYEQAEPAGHACFRRTLLAILLMSLGTPLASAQILPGFSDAKGWKDPAYYSTIQFPDINGDGIAGVCGRGTFGIGCDTF